MVIIWSIIKSGDLKIGHPAHSYLREESPAELMLGPGAQIHLGCGWDLSTAWFRFTVVDTTENRIDAL